MFTATDQEQIRARGGSLPEILNQISHFEKGFPYLKIVDVAAIGNGITRLSEDDCSKMVSFYESQLEKGVVSVKFVPASGAASRMFQSLFSFLGEASTNQEAELLLGKEKHKSVRQFFDQLSKFAFYPLVLEKLGTLSDPQGKMKYLEILRAVLSPKGLNYGFLPKGLLDFHSYAGLSRTPAEEHLVEGALYGTDAQGVVRIHFTVSPEHLPFFKKKCEMAASIFEDRYEVTYDISFSEQKPSTDTIAVDENNAPFRTTEGKLFFRPGGHGALLENLNDLQADLIFVKNIDNVVPDRLKDETIKYKKALAGFLLERQQQIFGYLRQLENPDQLTDAQIVEMLQYLEQELSTLPTGKAHFTDRPSKINYLKTKLNRPIRICGMVKNEGEPGGGPFWAISSDGTTTLQVVESSQIDLKNPGQAAIAARSTHFNPVDLVCGVRNYMGEKFYLPDFRDPETGFISSKSKDGKPLKAQELPGLWNGAMSDWITFFVEVPPVTFNPVKTVNDLLRAEHQPL
ncbi:MAG: DUF4301 family protein [Bacteroidetes bacterium]|nr:DUF4301 family protein [Bacteroidota bacterium]MCL6101789.1 DUF4301 family protein [Bacteroidota bacterium]